MAIWLTWVIVLAIGLVVGFIVHALMKYTQGSDIFATLIAGILGALIASYYVAPYVTLTMASLLADRFVWAAIGGAVLSFVFELMFVGSRRGRVLTS